MVAAQEAVTIRPFAMHDGALSVAKVFTVSIEEEEDGNDWCVLADCETEEEGAAADQR